MGLNRATDADIDDGVQDRTLPIWPADCGLFRAGKRTDCHDRVDRRRPIGHATGRHWVLGRNGVYRLRTGLRTSSPEGNIAGTQEVTRFLRP